MLDLNFTPFPNLTTVRLILRPLKIEDTNEIMFLRSDEKVNKFLDRQKARIIDDATNFIRKIEKGIVNNEWIYWAITIKNNDTLIGTICLFNIDVLNNKVEIGYELNPNFHGKGIMQEAISTVIKFGFDNLRIKNITAFPSADNVKSIKLLERNNFKFDIDFAFATKEELNNLSCYYLERKMTDKKCQHTTKNKLHLP